MSADILRKHLLEERIPMAHVAMLSASENVHFQFAITARAIPLETMRDSHRENDVAAVIVALLTL
ncbi:MAG: hypothetical protein COA52_05125 [Hyphomicrobiales bacterium]|nr:MAG: hypothetical protein COA52_05125 [Hyphomicrobiales bacterium]